MTALSTTHEDSEGLRAGTPKQLRTSGWDNVRLVKMDGGDAGEDEYEDFVARICASHMYQTFLEEDRHITEGVTRLVWDRCRSIFTNHIQTLKKTIADLQGRLRDLHTSSMKQILALKSAMGGGEEAMRSVVQHFDPVKFVAPDQQELLLLILQDSVQTLMQGVASSQEVERLEHYGEGLGSWKIWKARCEETEAREASLQRQYMDASEKLSKVSKDYAVLHEEAQMLKEDLLAQLSTKVETQKELEELRGQAESAMGEASVWRGRAERRKSALSDEELKRWKERQWHEAEGFKVQLLGKISQSVNHLGMVSEDNVALYHRERRRLTSLEEEYAGIMAKHVSTKEELNTLLKKLEQAAEKQGELALVQADLVQSRAEVKRLRERCSRFQAMAVAAQLGQQDSTAKLAGPEVVPTSPKQPVLERRSTLASVTDLQKLLAVTKLEEGVDGSAQTDLDVVALQEIAATMPEEVEVHREVLAEVKACLTKALAEFRRRNLEREANSIFAQAGLLDLTGKDCFQRLYADAMARPDRQERMRTSHRSAFRQDLDCRFAERGDLEKALERLISRKRDARAELMLFKRQELSSESLPGIWIELGGLPVFRVLPLAPSSSSELQSTYRTTSRHPGEQDLQNTSIDSLAATSLDPGVWDSLSRQSLTFAKERHFPEVLLPQQIAAVSEGSGVKLAPMSPSRHEDASDRTWLGSSQPFVQKVHRPNESEVMAVSKELSKRVQATIAGPATSPLQRRTPRSPRRLLASPRTAEQECRLPRLAASFEQTLGNSSRG